MDHETLVRAKKSRISTIKKHAITKAGGAELMFAPPAAVAHPLLESSYSSVLAVVSWPVPRAGIPSRGEDLDQIVSAKVPTTTAHSSRILLVTLAEMIIRIGVSANPQSNNILYCTKLHIQYEFEYM